jgi:aspartate-semialdehyde dehydrogenase
MGYRVAVVGATGNVGREMFNILEEVKFPVDKMHAIASRKSIGVEVSFGNQILRCEDLEQFDFSTVDIVLMSAGGSISKEWGEKHRRRPARSSSTTPATSGWIRTCRWWCRK